MNKIGFFVVFVAFLAGCSSSGGSAKWNHGFKGGDGQAADERSCLNDIDIIFSQNMYPFDPRLSDAERNRAQLHNAGVGIRKLFETPRLLEVCMNSKGWKKSEG